MSFARHVPLPFRRRNPLTALCVIFLSLTALHAADLPRRPNIVYVMADDLGIGDVASYGGGRCRVATPSFDRLAAEGMRFTDAHSVTSHCVPARVAIMTGRYPWRFRPIERRGRWGFLHPQFPTGQLTLGRLLRRVGYRTGYIGKWHLGTSMRTHDGERQNSSNVDYKSPLEVGPADHGFDYSFILPGSLDMYPYAFVRNNMWVGDVTTQKGWSAFNRVGPAAEKFEDHKVLDTFAREAEEFISARAADGPRRQPFFLYVALTAPHTPLSPRAEFDGKSGLGPYLDLVMETDDTLGRVLRALDAHGLADNTLVIATSDHGPAPCSGIQRKAAKGQVHELEKLGHFPSGIYRGYKFSAYEGGLRVPFLVRWPGVVPAASRCDRLIGLNDLMATVGDVVGATFADAEAPDSISYLPLLKNPHAEATRAEMVLRASRCFVLRQGTWKLVLGPGSGCGGHWGNSPTAVDAWQAAISGRSAPPSEAELRRAPFVQLFELAADPGESKNLAELYPGRIDALISMLEKASARGRSTPGTALPVENEGLTFLPSAPR
jgi:arylsulfatase A